jgi:hypothetical protein
MGDSTKVACYSCTHIGDADMTRESETSEAWGQTARTTYLVARCERCNSTDVHEASRCDICDEWVAHLAEGTDSCLSCGTETDDMRDALLEEGSGVAAIYRLIKTHINDTQALTRAKAEWSAQCWENFQRAVDRRMGVRT